MYHCADVACTQGEQKFLKGDMKVNTNQNSSMFLLHLYGLCCTNLGKFIFRPTFSKNKAERELFTDPPGNTGLKFCSLVKNFQTTKEQVRCLFLLCHLCSVGVRRTLGPIQKLPDWIGFDISCELWKEDENESLQKLGIFLLFPPFFPLQEQHRILCSFHSLFLLTKH